MVLNKKHIVIGGGSGFIGSRLAKRCQARGDEVVILAQENTEAERSNLDNLRAQGIAIVLGGVTDPEIVKQATNGCEQVFHLAAGVCDGSERHAGCKGIHGGGEG